MGDKIKKLSDAIRIGATIHPQCHGVWFLWDASVHIEKTCALGGAMMATFGGEEGLRKMPADYMTALQQKFNVPEHIIHSIVAKNDQLKLTREAIADWVESQGY